MDERMKGEGIDKVGATNQTNPKSKEVVAAFFDFDKTILSTDCAGKEAEEFWDLSFNEKQWWLYIKLTFFALVIFRLYAMHVIIDGEGINKWYYWLCYDGMLYEDLKQNAKRLYQDRLKYKLYPDILKLMSWHHRQGHLVYVVSASPIHLIRPFAEDPRYKDWITGLISTEIDVNEETGRCTGRAKDESVCIGPQKAVIQTQLSKEKNIDLQQSFAYSDHHHDLEFLEAVGTPVVVNPTKQLQDIANQRHWKTMEVTMPITDTTTSKPNRFSVSEKKIR